MKKFISVVLVLVMGLVLLSGCSKSDSTAKTDSAQSTSGSASDQTLEQQLAAQGKTIRLGTLTFNNLTQEELSDRLNSHYKEAGKNYTFAYTYFDTLSSALMALKAQQIDRIDMCQSTAEYIAATNSDVSIRSLHWDDFNFEMAMLDKNAALLDSINTAISAMKADGTLETLTSNNIDALINGGDPEKVVMPVIDGAETVRVAVTGDLPPMDYTTAAGEPAGFNMAFLAELSKRINKNIELVTIDSGARIAALSSGTVDALFWARTTGDAKFQADVPEGVKLSDPYFTDGFYGIYLKTAK